MVAHYLNNATLYHMETFIILLFPHYNGSTIMSTTLNSCDITTDLIIYIKN